MTDEKTGLQAPETPKTVTGETKTSQSAIWSLICGIAGLILCLPAIPAAILGIIALVDINKSKGLLKGTGMAIAGLILAGLCLFLWIFIIPIVAAIAIPAFLTTHQIDRETYPITKTYPIEKPIIEEPIEKPIGALKPYEDNENSAIASLKDLCSTEAVWRQQDVDGNGIKDYWTYDVSCFNRMYRADGTTKINFIDISFARADASRAEDDVFGFPAIEPWSTGPTQLLSAPKSGYWFQVMELDESGGPYNQNEIGENKIPATNNTKFAFVAYPDVYGSTGINIFIMNEAGTIYQTDPGSDEDKIVLQWPAKSPGGSPTEVQGPGGRNWQPAE